MIRGETFTVDLIFNAEYDLLRIDEVRLTLGNYDLCSLGKGVTIDGQTLHCIVPSDLTAVVSIGERPLVMALKDSTDGIRKCVIANIPVQDTGNQYANESTTDTANLVLNLEYLPTNITSQLLITDVSAQVALNAAIEAKASEDAAKVSEDNAKVSEDNAKDSETLSIAAKNEAVPAAATATTKAVEAAGSAFQANADKLTTEGYMNTTLAARDTTVTKAGEVEADAIQVASDKNYTAGYADDANTAKLAAQVSEENALDYFEAQSTMITGGPLYGPLPFRVNTSENSLTPNAFPTVGEAANGFSITLSADTESPVKDYVGFKRVLTNTLTAGVASCYRSWAMPLANQLRPSKISVSYWTKKTEWQAIYATTFKSQLGGTVFQILPPPNLTGTVTTVAAAALGSELTAANMSFSVIATVGDYIRVSLVYSGLVWASGFVASAILYYIQFNGNNSQSKSLTVIDFNLLFENEANTFIVYPDSGTLIGTKTLDTAYNLIAANTVNITDLQNRRGNVTLKKVGNFLYIANPFSATHNLVKKVEYIRATSFTNNPNLNFIEDYLTLKTSALDVVGTSVKVTADDICPASVNGSYIGGNHSFNWGYTVVMNTHGKTLADVGSVYKDGSNVEFVILRIVDANTLWIASKNQAVDGFTYTFARPLGTLTYVSSGTNTASIVVATSVLSGGIYSEVKPSEVKILTDSKNEITTDGTYQVKYIDILEKYDIVDFPSMILNLTANRPVGGYLTQPDFNNVANTLLLFSMSINYRFTENGNTVVSTNFRTYKKLKFSSHGFVQAGALTSGNLYCPKSLPISDGVTTYDFRKICNWTTPPASSIYLSPAYWENPLSPPDRVVNMNATANMQYGYITDRGIESSRKDVIYNAMFFYTSRKLYPVGVGLAADTILEANQFYSAVAFRSTTNPTLNPVGRTNYSYIEVGSDVFLYLDYHGALNDSIIPQDEWIGKKITVVESNARAAIIGDVVASRIEVTSTADANNNGFIVLKLT